MKNLSQSGDGHLLLSSRREIAPELGERNRHLLEISLNRPKIKQQMNDAQGHAQICAKIAQCVQKMPLISGIRKDAALDDEQRLIMQDEILRVIKEYTWLSLEEFEEIFRQGASGKFGEVYGFNARVVRNWIEVYYRDTRKALTLQQAKYEQYRKELEEENAKKIRQKAWLKEGLSSQRFLSHYRSLQKGLKTEVAEGSLNWQHVPTELDRGNLWYRKFESAGLLQLSREEKLVIYAEEKAKLVKIKRLRLNPNIIDGLAKTHSRSRAFRQEIARLLLRKVDMEGLIEEYQW